MPHYKFTAQADRDLEAITDYTLDKWGHRQADIYLDGLTALARKLADTPDLGAHHSHSRTLKFSLCQPCSLLPEKISRHHGNPGLASTHIA